MLVYILRPLPEPSSFFTSTLANLSGTGFQFHTIGFIAPIYLLFLFLVLKFGMRRSRTVDDAAAHPVRRAPRASSSASTPSSGRGNSAAQQSQLLTGAPRTSIPVESPRPSSFSHSLPTPHRESAPALNNTSVHDPPMRPMCDHKYPKEILLTIFQFVYPRHTTFPQSSSSLPLSLRLVCHHWKEIIDDMPELWLSLNPSLKNVGCTPDILSWYKDLTWKLSHKLNAFDHVTLRFPPDGDICKELLKHLLDNVVVKSKAIKLHLPLQLLRTDTMVQNAFSPTRISPTYRGPSNGPQMKYLRTIDWNLELAFHDQIPCSLGLPWSSLRDLPWNQLTSVTLGLHMTMHDCFSIFDNASSIEYLVLETIEVPLSASYPDDTTHALSCLRSLTIASEVGLSELFRRYDMQNLRTLQLQLGREANEHLDELLVRWEQLIHVTLDCELRVPVADRIVQKLAQVQSLVFNKGVTGDEAWTVHNILSSLKSFTSVLGNNNGIAMVMHFAEHVFHPSISTVKVPSIPRVIWSSQRFCSLGDVTLSSPILPEDFITVLFFAKKLCKGEFKVKDQLQSSHLTFNAIAHGINSLKLELDLEPTPSRLFLGALTLPSLTSFEFEATRRSSNIDAFSDLLNRSRCPITKLSLSCHGVDDESALGVLQHLTWTLEDLNIANPTFTEFGKTLLRGLTHTTNGTSGVVTRCLCPRLERLRLSRCVNSSSFRDMFLSRSRFPNECTSCGEVKKLKFVNTCFRRAGGDWSRWKRELKDLGIGYKLESSESSLY